MANICCLTPTTDVVIIATMPLGSNVKKFREAAGLTQTQLAELAGMDQQALAALEKRDSRSSSFAPALARALCISIDELMGGSPQQARLQVLRQEVALIRPDELVELIQLYSDATPDGRRQMMIAARNVEKVPGSGSAPAANDHF